MKFAEELESLRDAYLDQFEPASWADYDEFKKMIDDGTTNKDAYFLFWEMQLSKVAGVVAVHPEPTDAALAEFIHGNSEALRKAAKKWDKMKGGMGDEQQPMRKYMAECVLRTSLRARRVAASRGDSSSCNSPHSPLSPIKPFAKVAWGEEPAHDADAVHKWQDSPRDCVTPVKGGADVMNKRSVAASYNEIVRQFSLLSVVEIMLCFMFLLVVAFEPLMVEFTKEPGQTKTSYVASAVIFLEACLSTVTGCILAFLWNPNQKRGNSRWEDVVQCVHWRNICTYLPTGVLERAIGYSLSIIIINYMSPSTYMVLSQSRLVMTGILARVLLPKSPNRAQWHGLLIIVVGMLNFKMSHGGKKDDDESGNTPWGLILLAVLVLCKASAAIWLERALQYDEDESLIIQSANIDAGTILPVFTLAVLQANFLSQGAQSSADQQLSVLKIFDGMTGRVGMLVFYLLVKIWLSNVIIKRFSAVVKYVMYATAVILTYLAEIVLFDGEFKMVSFLGTIVVMQGVFLFADGKSFVAAATKKVYSMSEMLDPPAIGRRSVT
eukprot:TRINITY_DN3858_c0_g2_i1.p1 TRINITY_DN3858_c0_g2~~TRINITY_DN3858_c0_g2_i1.p1  ORF type:complete len:551 (+),score=77.22 TRINITY_DN3858_c0_g2_i1:128-1780(+)